MGHRFCPVGVRFRGLEVGFWSFFFLKTVLFAVNPNRLHLVLFYPKDALTNSHLPTPLLTTLLRYYLSATQKIIRELHLVI